MRRYRPLLMLFSVLILSGCDGNTLSVSPSVSVTGGSDVPEASGNPGQQLPPATHANAMPIFAHYVTWHRKNWQENSWDLANTIPVRHGCILPRILGEEPYDCESIGYDSLDTAIIRAQNQEFAANNIVPLASWWGPTGSPLEDAGDTFLNTYLGEDSPVQIGVLYEVTERLLITGGSLGVGTDILRTTGATGVRGNFDFDNLENQERFVADIGHLHQKYFSNPKYSKRFYRFRGRPVVFVWLTHSFTGNFKQATDRIRDKASIWCSDFNVTSTIRPDRLQIIGGCDVLTAYGAYQGDIMHRYGSHINEAYVKLYEESVAHWSLWLARNLQNVSLLLPLQFSYLDNRGNPEMDTTPEEARYFAGRVRDILEKASANCKNILPAVNVDSYNEAFERSSIELSRERGPLYMNIIREYFSSPLPAPGSCPAPR